MGLVSSITRRVTRTFHTYIASLNIFNRYTDIGVWSSRPYPFSSMLLAWAGHLKLDRNRKFLIDDLTTKIVPQLRRWPINRNTLGGGYVSIPIVDMMYKKIHFAHNTMHKVTKDMNLTV